MYAVSFMAKGQRRVKLLPKAAEYDVKKLHKRNESFYKSEGIEVTHYEVRDLKTNNLITSYEINRRNS